MLVCSLLLKLRWLMTQGAVLERADIYPPGSGVGRNSQFRKKHSYVRDFHFAPDDRVLMK